MKLSKTQQQQINESIVNHNCAELRKELAQFKKLRANFNEAYRNLDEATRILQLRADVIVGCSPANPKRRR